MKLLFSEIAFKEYTDWQNIDKSTSKDDKNRIVYRISQDYIEIIQCKGHYND